MYKCYLDGKLMYHPNMADKLPLAKAKVNLEVNKTGSFAFTIPKKNQKYGSIKKMKSIVKVYDGKRRLFRGRVLNAKKGMYNELQVTCEGELAFFIDSKQRPYEFKGSVEEYFHFIIGNHNASTRDPEKQFKVGRCTVTDPNDYITRSDSKYMTTWDTIQEKLIKELGGYIWTREEEDGVYVDYLADFDTINSQEIRFGENLLDFEDVVKGQDIATVIIPLGAKILDENGMDTGKRLTIAEINNGLDYVYNQEAVEKFGWIEKVVEFDDVTLPENLMTKGEQELQNHIALTRTIELTAIDLHHLNKDIRSFQYGAYAKVVSEPHELDDIFLVRKLSINILDAADGLLYLGDEKKTFVDQQVQSDKNIGYVSERVENVEADYKTNVRLVKEELSSEIKQESEAIKTEVSERYALETNETVSMMRTELEQTKNAFEFGFEQFSKDLDDLQAETNAEFQHFYKYIRFENGAIILGEAGSEITLKQEHDRIVFLSNNVEIAYWKNKKFYAVDGEFVNSLKLGMFLFKVENNGSLSLC